MELIDKEDICSVDICRDINCEKCPFFQKDGVCLLRARVFKLKAVDAVPVSELIALRDEIYWKDEINMSGLSKLNQLIAKYREESDATP